METTVYELQLGDTVEMSMGSNSMQVTGFSKSPEESYRQVTCSWLSRDGEPQVHVLPEVCLRVPDPLLRMDRQPHQPVYLLEPVQARIAQIALDADLWHAERVARIQHFLCQSLGAVLQSLTDEAHALIPESLQLQFIEKAYDTYYWRWRQFVMDFEDQIVEYLISLGWRLAEPALTGA